MAIEKSESNNAIFTHLTNVRPHPNADRVKLATVLGNQVVVGLDSEEGDLVIFFDSNLQLSHKFLHHNNLYSNPELNADTSKKGYFGNNGRVRAQRFRGELSMGFVSYPHMLTNVPGISENMFDGGTEFHSVNGVKICYKYIAPRHRTKYDKRHGKKRVRRPRSDTFWIHWNTKQLSKCHDSVGEGLVYVEEKVHGTSSRIGHVFCDLARPWWKVWSPKTGWRVVSGTRRVDSVNNHIPQVRRELERRVSPHLKMGEQIYCEIYGYDGASLIQPDSPYGCAPGEWRAMLYRVTVTTPDGLCIDLDRELVYQRAEVLGLEKPPVLDKFYFDGETHFDVDRITTHVSGVSTLDAGTMREGVVVWFRDQSGRHYCLKHKNPEFLIRESSRTGGLEGDVEDSL